MSVSQSMLKALGARGIFPGPLEDEGAFIIRVQNLERVQKDPITILGQREYQTFPEHRRFFNCRLDWILYTYSNRRLLPWQGAVTWMIETQQVGTVPLIQLRKSFENARAFFYDRDEVLLHEAVHVMRLPFHEPRFEEILAYFHAQSKWRRTIGPLFRKPKEAVVFVSLVLLSTIFQGLFPLYATHPLSEFLKWVPLAPLIYLLIKGLTVVRDRLYLKRALATIRRFFPNAKDPFIVAMRLTDQEIITCAKGHLPSLVQDKPLNLRWRQIIAQFS